MSLPPAPALVTGVLCGSLCCGKTGWGEGTHRTEHTHCRHAYEMMSHSAQIVHDISQLSVGAFGSVQWKNTNALN